MNHVFKISKLIIKKRLKTLTELEKSQLDKFNKDYPFSKNINFEDLVDRIDGYSTINKDKAWEAIEDKFQKDKSKPVFSLLKNPWYKYAAAAVLIGILATSYFFKDNFFNTSVDHTPIIVNNNIKVGTDKATLTLEDGSMIALEKGNTYQTENINSDGEQIVYNAGEQNVAMVVYNYITIPRGGQFFVKLSDGTQVWLNSESQLKYPVSFKKGEIRQVELVYGEAYFDVSPSTEHNGAKFKVFNKSQEIEVLGTEFNVKAYKDETNIYTTLVEGKVLVSTTATDQILKPTQQATLNLYNNTVSISTVNVYNEISWKEGVFSFHRKPLKEIIKVLSRWYDMDFKFADPDLERIGFNGVLGKDQHIEEILETIKSFGVIKSYEINDRVVILK